ncbi:MAG: glycosyltransferase [Janthinobacterium lividum]
MDNRLLTIAIPTYNRAALLDKCLAAIATQFATVATQVEVLISNNAATDHTRDIAEKYRTIFPLFRYQENETNIGPDLNIAKCFELAETKYVWIFSDDDILLPGTLAPIVQILASNELGVLYVTPTWYVKEIADATIPNEPFTCRVYDDQLEFLAQVHYWVTFITGNIVNKSLIDGLPIIYQFKGTNLMQLGWTIPAIFKAQHNAKVSSLVVLGRAPEGIEYRFFKVFSLNLNAILFSLIKGGFIPPAARDIINRKLITDFFPPSLVAGRKSSPTEKPFVTLFQAFKSYPEFWRVLAPAFVKPYYAGPVAKMKQRVKQLILRSFAKLSSATANAKAQASAAQLRAFGVNSQLPTQHVISGPQYISIGRRFRALDNLRIEVHTPAAGDEAAPQVVIGDDVQIGYDCHISCLTQVVIGNAVHIGNRVSISDNTPDDRASVRRLRPASRDLVALGSITIGDNVLIEDGAIVCSGVQIGEFAIIKAGTVVNYDVAAHTVLTSKPTQEIDSLLAQEQIKFRK